MDSLSAFTLGRYGKIINVMLTFLDTEFTSTLVRPRLISIGLVSADGERTFYAELSDTWRPQDCSLFVLESVVPLLVGGTASMTMAELTMRLRSWLEGFGEPVKLATDHPRWDWPWIQQMFTDSWPANLAHEPLLLQLDAKHGERFNQTVESAYTTGLRRHHALDDAKANRLWWLAMAGGG